MYLRAHISGELGPGSRPEPVDGKACRTALGELSFSVVSAEGLASSQNLYEDLMRLVLNDTAVKRLLLVPAPGKDDWAETLSALSEPYLTIQYVSPIIQLHCHRCCCKQFFIHPCAALFNILFQLLDI